jgi:hypothetical protein
MSSFLAEGKIGDIKNISFYNEQFKVNRCQSTQLFNSNNKTK